MTKYALLIVAIALIGAIQVSSYTKAARVNHLIIGAINSGDRELFRQVVSRPGVNGTIQSQDIVFNGGLVNITRIRALDQILNGQGGYASLIRGGLNQRNATIRVQSARAGWGYNFIVDIFGR